MHISLIYFFIETKIGYSFYIFCVLYGLFGCDKTNCYVSNIFAIFFVLYIISTVVELWFLVKIPFIRKILDNFLTKEYILKHFNDHILSKIAFKTFGLFIATILIDSGTAYVEQMKNQSSAIEIMDEYYKSLNKAELKHDPNSKLYKDAINKAYCHLDKKPEGLIFKSINKIFTFK